MRRAHRSLHLLMWLLLAPAGIAGLALALSMRPAAPLADIPDAIATEAP